MALGHIAMLPRMRHLMFSPRFSPISRERCKLGGNVAGVATVRPVWPSNRDEYNNESSLQRYLFALSMPKQSAG